MKRLSTIICTAIIVVLSAGRALPFGGGGGGCGEGECRDCHNLTKDEAVKIMKDLPGKVLGVHDVEVPGIWELEVEQNSKKYLIYMDYSKEYIFSGNILRISDKANITRTKLSKVRPAKGVKISLDDALLIGKKDASKKAILFTDPQCPFCAKMHPELKKAVKMDPDLAIFIKMFPLKMHPEAYSISKSIICEKSMEMLETSFSRKSVPEPTCETDAVDKNIEVAGKLGIRSTPTLLLPDGRIVPGYRVAEDIIDLVNSK